MEKSKNWRYMLRCIVYGCKVMKNFGTGVSDESSDFHPSFQLHWPRRKFMAYPTLMYI